MHTEIGIVGAGLVGRVLAINLLAKGYHVTLFDEDSPEGELAAGLTAAGMLAPFAELETAESKIFDLGQRSIELWPGLLQCIGLEAAFERKGSLITAHYADWPELEHFIGQLRAKVPEASSIQTLDKAGIQALEPELESHSKGFYLPDEGQVNAQQFMATSAEYLLTHADVTWHANSKVTHVEPNRIEMDQVRMEFDWVFDSRGIGAQKDIKELRGVRGEVFWLDAPDVHLNRPVRLMHPRYRIYIVPRPKGRYVVGATEIESEDRSPVSVRSTLEMLSAVYSVHPGFGEARVVKTLTNLRPALSDNLPKIEQSEGLTRINGLYRHGYLLSPAVVEQALNEGLYAADKSTQAAKQETSL